MPTHDDEVLMGRSDAKMLVDHVDREWSPGLTFDERQTWGKLLMACDVDYAVATLTTMKKASPQVRPEPGQFPAAYLATTDAAHAVARPPEPEPAPEPQLPMDRESVAGREHIARIRAEQDARRSARSN